MPGPTAFAFNRTRRAFLATELAVADSYWTRLRGLMGMKSAAFPAGRGLWIVPSRGVHTFAMRFPIDVAYLDGKRSVIYMAHELKPWRMARVIMKASSVIELPAKTLKSTGSSIGDEIEITIGSPREQANHA